MNLREALEDDGDYRDRSRQRAIEEFEEAKLTLLLKTVGLNANRVLQELREHVRQTTGGERATFQSFADQYSFPFLFGVSKLNGVKLHTDPRSLLPSVLQRFDATPFATAYDTFYGDNRRFAHGRLLGLIFPRKGFRSGLVIYRVESLDTVRLCATEAAVIRATQTAQGFYYTVVRGYQQLIKSIYEAGWRPS